jgi:hypothetical protein
MRRRSSALGVAGLLGILGVGGLALAQDGLIVDPWQHAVASLLPPKAEAVSVPGPVGVASFPIEHPTRAPAVVPVGPPLRGGASDPGAPLSVAPAGPLDAVVDPWVEAPAHAPPSLHRATPSQWSWQLREIVDPWAKGPLAVAATDPLIVDPWAPRSESRY